MMIMKKRIIQGEGEFALNFRLSVATVLGDCPNSFTDVDVIPLFEFAVKTALYDPIESIKEEFQKSVLKLISAQGKNHTDAIFQFCGNFNSFLPSQRNS
jgi:hypothetical protein